MLRILAIGSGAAVLVVAATVAQAGQRAKPLPGLPAYTAGYTSWTRLNSRPIPPRTNDAHSGTKNVYASRLPPRGSRRYPVGTVIVKEIRRRGERYVGVLAAMRKTRARSNNGWVMVEWERGGPAGRFSVLGRGEVCYSCHVGAKRTDYVFTKRR